MSQLVRPRRALFLLLICAGWLMAVGFLNLEESATFSTPNPGQSGGTLNFFWFCDIFGFMWQKNGGNEGVMKKMRRFFSDDWRAV